VLEIGTFSGYGALALASGLGPGGRVWTLERDEERAAFARAHIEASPLAGRIEIVVGPALDTLARLDGPWDLVFIDADKTGYPAYVDAVLADLAPRGVIALDNTLRDGEVLDPPAGDAGAAAVGALNERLAADPRLVTTLLPVRDGITLVRHAA
jgi:caffeoyl-CoA O-methyltransferase